MQSSWQIETGHLAIRWSPPNQCASYRPDWMQDTPAIPAGHLLHIPDFASHSPFGGPSWFQPWSPTGISIRSGDTTAAHHAM